jgi:hypothetical protein
MWYSWTTSVRLACESHRAHRSCSALPSRSAGTALTSVLRRAHLVRDHPSPQEGNPPCFPYRFCDARAPGRAGTAVADPSLSRQSSSRRTARSLVARTPGWPALPCPPGEHRAAGELSCRRRLGASGPASTTPRKPSRIDPRGLPALGAAATVGRTRSSAATATRRPVGAACQHCLGLVRWPQAVVATRRLAWASVVGGGQNTASGYCQSMRATPSVDVC